MLSYLSVGCAALVASGLTLYSGFGLGTLLMPVFALFFPVEIAVAATAIVHATNTVFKIALFGRFADRAIVWRFGIPAIVAAFAGAMLLRHLAGLGALGRYSIGSHVAAITPLKLSMAFLMFAFALFELLPAFRSLTSPRRFLFVGGILSGFFGGLSGHQGALRSAFLTKTGVSTQAFVGTNAVIGFLVDCTRIATYAVTLVAAERHNLIATDQWQLIVTGTIAAMTGVLIGRRFLHTVTMHAVQMCAGVLLVGIAITLGLGIL